ncbi:hypothetical protein M0R45_008742 [Rubus argutus]|uniref:Secreted protein n=1 Tax=Rubus argutus TaxID=59490 RepID=A0AAW1Y5E0_RUBAR
MAAGVWVLPFLPYFFSAFISGADLGSRVRGLPAEAKCAGCCILVRRHGRRDGCCKSELGSVCFREGLGERSWVS